MTARDHVATAAELARLLWHYRGDTAAVKRHATAELEWCRLQAVLGVRGPMPPMPVHWLNLDPTERQTMIDDAIRPPRGEPPMIDPQWKEKQA